MIRVVHFQFVGRLNLDRASAVTQDHLRSEMLSWEGKTKATQRYVTEGEMMDEVRRLVGHAPEDTMLIVGRCVRLNTLQGGRL